MIENECVMTRDRFVRWTVPKFYALPIFYIYICIIVSDVLGFWYYIKHGGDSKQLILLFFLIAICFLYLAFFHKWIVAISQYKELYRKLGNKKWTQKVIINKESIELYVNDDLTNKLSWSEIKKVAIAKSFIALKRNIESEKIIIFDDSYKTGTKESLLTFIKGNYKNLSIVNERCRYNC